MTWEKAFDGEIYLEGVSEWSIRELTFADGSKCIGVYVKTDNGVEKRYALGGSQPLDWIEALLAATGATVQNVAYSQKGFN